MNYTELQKQYPELFRNDSGFLTIVTDPGEIRQWQEQRRKQLAEKGQPRQWADIGILIQDPYVTFVRDLVEFAPGKRGSYGRLINTADLHGGQAVVAFPVYQGHVLLLHHFRHTTRKFHYEVPRGFGEPGTSAEEQARREIEEEMQGVVKQVVDLGPYHNNTGMECSKVELFFVELERYGNPEKEEGIEAVRAVDLDEFETMLRDAMITDGFTIAAYTRAKLRGLLG